MMTVNFAPKVLAALLLLLSIRPAIAVEARDLAGWWIAIDRLFPEAYETQGIVPMEELLIVGSDGRVENRFMMFWGPDADLCHNKKVHCSDAPISARARIVVAGDQLTFTESVKSDNLIDDRPELDLALRLLTVTSTRSWTLSREVDGRLLVLRPNLMNPSRLIANIPTRTFAKIDPDRLRRLRSLLHARELSATKHWRCFLANATADDPAFASLRDHLVELPQRFSMMPPRPPATSAPCVRPPPRGCVVSITAPDCVTPRTSPWREFCWSSSRTSVCPRPQPRRSPCTSATWT